MQQALHRSSLVPRGFVVESACYEGDKAVITVRASGSVGLCPSCGTVSRRIHSRYRRRVTDLPLSGRVRSRATIAIVGCAASQAWAVAGSRSGSSVTTRRLSRLQMMLAYR